MSKNEFDIEFSKRLEMFRKIALGIRYKKNRNSLEIDTIINETYLYIYEILDQINNADDLQRYCIKFIKSNIGWTNSRMNKLDSVNDNDFDVVNIAEKYGDDDFDLNSKIELEKWYNEKICLLRLYRDQESNKQKQIIYDCYFNKGITKGVDLAEHLGINKDYACSYIREMKKEILKFSIKLKNNENL